MLGTCGINQCRSVRSGASCPLQCRRCCWLAHAVPIEEPLWHRHDLGRIFVRNVSRHASLYTSGHPALSKNTDNPADVYLRQCFSVCNARRISYVGLFDKPTSLLQPRKPTEMQKVPAWLSPGVTCGCLSSCRLFSTCE